MSLIGEEVKVGDVLVYRPGGKGHPRSVDVVEIEDDRYVRIRNLNCMNRPALIFLGYAERKENP